MARVAYQGEAGAFSQEAARGYFGSDAKLHALPAFRDVFRAVKSGNVSAGIIPIENSTSGSVHENYDLLLAHKLFITGEIKLRVHLHLMTLPGVGLKQIHTIYSHPQALGQCGSLFQRMKNVVARPHHDTAGAARMIREEQLTTAAALASEQAARTYGLRILKRNVEQNHHNYTRFLVIARATARPKGHAKTSIVFSVKNIPGALFKAISVFSMREVNLLKIESRPLIGKPWEYLFYLDVEGSHDDEPVKNALRHLEELTVFRRLLGSFQQGKTIEG
jgi:prephenate dehydratase